MDFPPKVAEQLLVACHRHCCICHKFAGTKMQIHHIVPESEGGQSNFENGIPLCLDCHADVMSYNAAHPIGRKYTPSELRTHRDQWLGLCQKAPWGPELQAPERPVFQTRSEPSSAWEEHAKNLAELNERIHRLNPQRVKECKEQILAPYLAETMPRKVAGICKESELSAPGMTKIGLWCRIKLGEFNDPSFSWKLYFSQVGQAVAVAEQRLLQQTVLRAITSHSIGLSRSNPDFSALEGLLHSLASKGFEPNVLLAPVELLPPFYRHFHSRIDRGGGHGEYLLASPKVRLRLFWSNQYAPLQQFLIFNSGAGRWHVFPDQQTGQAITIALGESKLFCDEVEYAAETTARYELIHPERFTRVEVRDQDNGSPPPTL